MILLTKNPNIRYSFLLILIILLFFISKFAFCSEISELSRSEQYPVDEEKNTSRRPEGAIPIPIKRKWFENFSKERVIDKYYTKDGKKVKVILIRRHRPIFGRFIKWKNKRKMKRKAKKKYKMDRNPKNKKGNIFGRLMRRGKKSENNTKEPTLENVNYEKDDESVSKSDIFEDNDENPVEKNEKGSNKMEKAEKQVDYTASIDRFSSYDKNSITGENTDSSDMKSPITDYEATML
ncbi:uncharacterized protein cubi_03529 [Cryptosporidium ubiquitum]|uniref:Uncharacterized protein n=1 Tax=Cryptosporidium ubiquitum TaxID=857276 RepID=A0A1J4MJV2_9CRYT|nr:uncharacterized protein cubi_03529 [Cryptosporidium ubiquitum]OII73731.1 hypothetical protein cubi_03529 [Cryptosporidium ubiquitum]